VKQNSILEPLAASREWVFPFLTLDVVLPFFEMMGLPLADHSYDFQKVLRDATVAVRRSERQPAAGEPQETWAEFFAAVEAGLGPAPTGRLAWWLRNILHARPRDNLGLSDWDHVLRYCRRSADRWKRLGFPESMSGEALRRFRRAIDVTELTRRCEEIQACPLSDWDLHMYASELYDFDDDLEGPSSSPFITVQATVRDYRQYLFWAWILRTLRPDQLAQLWDGGQQIVQYEALTSVSELPHPSTFGIGL
jgi:hypothetical protein